eukprot:508550-Rhodomonas_salina.4
MASTVIHHGLSSLSAAMTASHELSSSSAVLSVMRNCANPLMRQRNGSTTFHSSCSMVSSSRFLSCAETLYWTMSRVRRTVACLSQHLCGMLEPGPSQTTSSECTRSWFGLTSTTREQDDIKDLHFESVA